MLLFPFRNELAIEKVQKEWILFDKLTKKLSDIN